MTSKSLGDIYGGEGAEGTVVPPSNYDATVKDARGRVVKEGKSGVGNIFVDLEILNGPSAGALVNVIINVPDTTNRNALYHFSNKTNAFKADIKAAIDSSGASDAQAILDAITGAMIGKTIKAELGVVPEGRPYAGTNELIKTESSGETAPAAVAPVATPAVAPAPAPAPAVVEAAPETVDVNEPDLPF